MLATSRGSMKAFVHLAYNFDADAWEKKWLSGKLIGINDRYPYGYYRAEALGAQITYSKGYKESIFLKFFRLSLRVILGFDIVHAFQNRKAMLASDVIWTHTESQSLAVLFLLWFVNKEKRPRTISQFVWLIDKWSKYTPLHRMLYKKLLAQADILTFHSPENRQVAQKLFAGARCELVLFGINADFKTPPQLKTSGRAARILSVGNDVHRDWKTLIDAVIPMQDVDLKIVSQTIKKGLTQGAEHIAVQTVDLNEELEALYRWADLIVVPLGFNLHASGITVIEEAALRGLPTVASDVGGLRAYFSDDEVFYVRGENPEALREVIGKVIASPDLAYETALRAQARMGDDALSSYNYACKHVELSQEIIK